MSNCCQTPQAPPSNSSLILTIALAGNPNSGKTTIFNALTGLRQKVANYPGVTVEKKTGRCRLPDGRIADVIDLPGTYSLISRSPDEHVAMEVLRGLRVDTRAPDVVVVIVDASNLQRNLYLVSQLIELGRPLVVALNMIDIARRRGLHVSAERLQGELKVPVIPLVGSRRQGIDELKAAILHASVAPLPDFQVPAPMKEEFIEVAGALASRDSLTVAELRDRPQQMDRYKAVAERLLIGDRAADIAPLAQEKAIASLLAHAEQRLGTLGIDPMQADVEAHYLWIEQVAAAAGADAPPARPLNYAPPRTLSQRIDAILIHKVWGLLIFAAIMGVLFVALFWLAQPIMDAIQNGITALGVLTTRHMADGPLKALVNDGVFKGVGTVVVFVPQIALLFLFLAILEDTGYLARAAFLMDRLLSKLGLHGKSFIPLLSSFACAIPGIMATRTIENRRERLATIMVAPFMSCSARLPVYTLLIGAFFAQWGHWAQAGIMLSCYLLGIVAAAGTAWIFKRTFAAERATSFILELPSYKLPQVSQVGRAVYTNTLAFLTKAGTTIFFLSVILWAMAYYPRLPRSRTDAIRHQVVVPRGDGADADIESQADHAVGAAQSEYSIAGRAGHFLEPALRPLGFDWKMGIGLISAFAAREVFVSSMGIVYSVGEVEEGHTSDLASAMRSDRYDSGPRKGQVVWTPVVAVSLLVWFVLAFQCMSTFAVVRRETGGWRWPLFMLVYMNALAYVVSLLVFQVGSRLVG